MFKNIFLPLLLILLATIGTVYIWVEPFPKSLLSLIGFVILSFSSMYIAFYLSFIIFPDNKNIHLPPIPDLFHKQELKSVKQPATRGYVFANLLTIGFITGAIFLWLELADQYKNFELNNYGREANAVVIRAGYQKGIGDYIEYEFRDEKGSLFKDKISDTNLDIGDTIRILYSVNRPIISKLLLINEGE